MEINELKQAKNLLMWKERILLATHQKMDADWLSSMLALWVFLERLWKKVKIISTDPVPEGFEFLPFTDKVLVSSNAVKDFVISIKTAWAEVDKLRYNTEWDKLNIIITPKLWDLNEENVTFSKWIWKFDLIVCVDTWDLDYLWSIYTDNVEMFYETPVVNIDHHVTNTAFWQINLVDITASSSTMIIFDLMKEFSENWNEMIDEDVATLLMAWLITDTWSFQHNNTSPRALDLAADLMDFWARQQEIIKNIYKTKHLSTLKVWWKVLSKIQEDPIFRILWSTVTKEDLRETWADLSEADLLIDELMTNAPWAEVVILIKESFDWNILVSMRWTSITVDVSTIAQHFWWWWHKQAAWFKIPNYKNFELEVWNIISYIQDFQKKRLWILDEDLAEIESKNKEINELAEWIWDVSKFIDIQKENDEHFRDTGIEFPKSISVSWKIKSDNEDWLPFSIDLKEKKNEIKPEIKNTSQINKNIWIKEKAKTVELRQEKKIQIKNLEIKPKQEQKNIIKKPVQVVQKKVEEPIRQQKINKTPNPENKIINNQNKNQQKPKIVVQKNEIKKAPQKINQEKVVQKEKQPLIEKKEQKISQIKKNIQKPLIEKKPVEVKKTIKQVEKKIAPEPVKQDIKKEPEVKEVRREKSQVVENKPVEIKKEPIKGENNPVEPKKEPVKVENTSQANQEPESSIVSKEQADGYARRFYELLQSADQNSPEYKKYYDWYMYYAKLAGWNI